MKKRLLLLFLCGLFLTGCRFSMPVLVPDNKTVTTLVSSYVSDRDSVKGSFSLSYELQTGKKFEPYVYKGSFTGHRDGLSGFQIKHEKQVSDYYYDVSGDLLYEVCGDVSHKYEDGGQALDVTWFQDQLDVGGFKYSGEMKRDGKTMFVLDRTYSDEGLSELLAHLHIPLPGTVQTSRCDMTVTLYLDRYTGELLEVMVQGSDTGNPVKVLSDNHVESKLLNFELQFRLDFSHVSDVQLPGSCKDLDSEEFPARLFAGSAGTSGFVKDGCLLSEDGNWLLQYGKHKVFDTIVPQEDGSLLVTPSEVLTGEPSLSLSYVSGLNAYDSAKIDAKEAFDYYDKHGFAEIHVDLNPVQFVVDGYPAYYFGSQYTETEFSYVYQSYSAYIELADDLYVKCVLYGMTDRGVNGALNDTYLRSVLSALSISQVEN